MSRTKYFALTRLIVLIVAGGLIPIPAQADEGTQAIRLSATGYAGPIGVIKSLGPVVINGREASGEQQVWGGDLIQAPDLKSARIFIDSIGMVTIDRRAMVRLSIGATSDEAGGRVLVASLISGDMTVRLKRGAGAYIEACETRITAGDGASFTVRTSGGHVMIDKDAGEVQAQPQAAQPKYKLALVKADASPLKRPIGLGLRIDIAARSTRSVQWQVTDENDKPVPDIPIILTLSGKGVGGFGQSMSPSFTATTDANGIVNAPFTAGESPANGTMNARIANTDISKSADVRVKRNFMSTRDKLLMGAAAATVVVIASDPFGKGPIKAVPPPTILP